MPFKNKGYPKKSYGKKNKSTRAIAQSALRVAKTLQKNDELKWLDTTISDPTIALTGTVFDLNPITQGTTESTMIGDHCRMTSIQYNVYFNTIGQQLRTFQVRFLLVKFKDEDAGSAITNVLLDSSAILNVNSLYEMTGRDNYKILEDKVITVVPGINNTNELGQRVHRVKRQLNSKFSSSESVHENSVKLFVLHNYVDEQVVIAGKSRVFFKEL